MKLLTTEEVAARLGVSIRRVQAMIKSGSIKADKMGRDWFIKESDLASVRVYGVAGRPEGSTKKAVSKKRSAK